MPRRSNNSKNFSRGEIPIDLLSYDLDSIEQGQYFDPLIALALYNERKLLPLEQQSDKIRRYRIPVGYSRPATTDDALQSSQPTLVGTGGVEFSNRCCESTDANCKRSCPRRPRRKAVTCAKVAKNYNLKSQVLIGFGCGAFVNKDYPSFYKHAHTPVPVYLLNVERKRVEIYTGDDTLEIYIESITSMELQFYSYHPAQFYYDAYSKTWIAYTQILKTQTSDYINIVQPPNNSIDFSSILTFQAQLEVSSASVLQQAELRVGAILPSGNYALGGDSVLIQNVANDLSVSISEAVMQKSEELSYLRSVKRIHTANHGSGSPREPIPGDEVLDSPSKPTHKTSRWVDMEVTTFEGKRYIVKRDGDSLVHLYSTQDGSLRLSVDHSEITKITTSTYDSTVPWVQELLK